MVGVIQRVAHAKVTVDGRVTGSIGSGILLFVGVSKEDTEEDVRYIAGKCVNLRIFSDENGNMNRSLIDTGGDLLVVSQFTLLGDTKKGRRPSFCAAAEPDRAKNLYELLIAQLRSYGVFVAEGIFGAMMEVSLVNAGPVTLIIDSNSKRVRPKSDR
ncbi:MAG: D-tyrosyl-tRNA(Tyr) deacylase [Spirochaetes bacterium]|nr:D-tyrosyl-tRNA(Tyr) deacylase [Spirochaetota bacterium]